MDWKKTKNILIAALLIMNIFLIYNIYFKEDIQQHNRVDFFAVKELLLERKIDISAIEQVDYTQMPIYSVKKNKYNLVTLSGLESNGFVLSDRNDVLNIYYNLSDFVGEDLDEIIEKVKNIVEVDDTNSKLIYNYEANGKTFILYNQRYNDDVFDDGFLKIEYLPEMYVLFEYQWLNIVDNGEIFNGDVYPIEKSILSLLNEFEDTEDMVEIVDFQIVYNVEEKENLVIDNIVMSETFPFWRAVTKDNRNIYFNGLR
ncbi:MAG: hypothetical protein U9Q80_09220 [Bacillota bacterium]|nr:hypothetical protein [Bacillota bacterium]